MPIVLKPNSNIIVTTNNFNFSIFCNGNEYKLDSKSCNYNDNNLLSSCTFEEIPNLLNKKKFKKRWTLNLSCGKNLFEELEKQNQTLEGENQTLEGENQTLEGENQTLEDENQTLEGENQTLEGENQTLEGENQTLENENQTLEDENQTLEGENQTLENENQRLEDANKTLKVKNETLVGQINELEGNNKTLLGQINELVGNNQTLVGQINELEEKNNTLKENLFFVGSNISTDFFNICDQESVAKFGQQNLSKVDSTRFSHSANFLCDKYIQLC